MTGGRAHVDDDFEFHGRERRPELTEPYAGGVSVPREVEEAIVEGCTPTGRDLIEARAAILGSLAMAETCTEREFADRLCRDRGVPLGAQALRIEVHHDGQRYPAPSADEPALVKARIEYATREALGRLVAEGIVTQAAGDMYHEETRSLRVRLVTSGGSSELPVQYPWRAPEFGASPGSCRWRLVDRGSARHELAQVPLDAGREELLGPRGLEVLGEAIACFNRGRFIAAADLLAAASEAAWFGVAAAAHGRNSSLDRLVESGFEVGQVIRMTSQMLADTRAIPAGVRHDIVAQAARFRDLRNYGLHPVGSPDQEREPAFTETGCAVLFMTAGRYFAQLDEAREALAATD